MNFALTAQKSRELDGYMTEVLKIPGIVLMENASLGVVREIENMLPHGKVCVFCGTPWAYGKGLSRERFSFGKDSFNSWRRGAEF